MEIEIYEDQTGLMLFPEKRMDKNRDIVSLFDNKIDLCINTMQNKIEICCYVLAQKGLARPLGYYILYTDDYRGNTFTNLKQEVNNILRSLALKPVSDDKENIIFNNIEKFDLVHLDPAIDDAIVEALVNHECLEYKTGNNINELAVFCKRILRNADEVIIAISSEQTELGNINITINKKYDEPSSPTPTEKTKEILIKYSKIRENKKRQQRERAGIILKEGFALAEEGINLMANAGCSYNEIKTEMDIRTSEILNRISLKTGRSEKSKTPDISRAQSRERAVPFQAESRERTAPYKSTNDNDSNITIDLKYIILIGVIILIGIAIFSYFQQYDKSLTSTPTPSPTPTLTPSPTSTLTPSPTPTLTSPTPTLTPSPTPTLKP